MSRSMVQIHHRPPHFALVHFVHESYAWQATFFHEKCAPRSRRRSGAGPTIICYSLLMDTNNDIPILDIAPLLKNLDRHRCQNIIERIRMACTETGVFYVTGHGMEETKIKEVFE